MIYDWAWFAILNFLLRILHFVWSNDSIVSKSVEGLASVFEIFILHDGHWDSISVFPLNEAVKQFRRNLCSHFKFFIGFFCYWVCLWSAFAFYLGAKFSGSKYPFLEKSNSFTNVAILNTVFSPIFEGSCCYCALPFNSSRHNRAVFLSKFTWL